jgi:hypothetical protein
MYSSGFTQRPDDKVDIYQDPDLSAERAVELVKQGFTAIKFDPAGPYTAFDGRQLRLPALDLCERFMRELRSVVGNRADLLFGTHGQMTAAGAIRLARRLEPFDPLWFEEPVPPDAPVLPPFCKWILDESVVFSKRKRSPQWLKSIMYRLRRISIVARLRAPPTFRLPLAVRTF